MKSRRLRNKKHLKSKRLSKKVKVQHKKSKKTMRRRRNVTRKRGGRDIPLKRVPEIEYADPVMMIDTTRQQDNWQPLPTTPPGSPDIRTSMDIVESQPDTAVEEQFPRMRLFSETDDEDSDYNPVQENRRARR